MVWSTRLSIIKIRKQYSGLDHARELLIRYFSESELVSSIDEVFKGFCEGCVAAPDACPLAGNMTATQLENSLYAILETLKTNPIPISDPSIPGGGILIDYSVVKGFVLPKLNFPSNWPQLAQTIAAMATGSAAGLPSSSANMMASSATADGGDAESQFGIKCSDVLQHAESVADLLPTVEARRRLSRFGGDAFDMNLARCAQWKLPAKERYSGDFRSVTTQNPVFIINNRFDPVTPLVSARNASQTYNGSVLLEQVSYGVSAPALQGGVCLTGSSIFPCLKVPCARLKQCWPTLQKGNCQSRGPFVTTLNILSFRGKPDGKILLMSSAPCEHDFWMASVAPI